MDRIGLFFAYAQAAGDVSGFAIGEQQDVGHERINSYPSGKTLFWQPYLKLSLWHGFEGDDEVVFGGSDRVSSEHRTTGLEAGGGIVIKIQKSSDSMRL